MSLIQSQASGAFSLQWSQVGEAALLSSQRQGRGGWEAPPTWTGNP